MNYKVGDKVRVRSDLVANKTYGSDSFVVDMERQKGKIVTITRVDEDKKKYMIDANFYWWTDEMFEPATKFKIGDSVRVKKDLKVGDGTGVTTAVKDMLKYCDRLMTIKGIRRSWEGYTIYTLDDNGEDWAWTDEMLEPIYQEGGVISIHDIATHELWTTPFIISKDKIDALVDAWSKLGCTTFNLMSMSKEDKTMKFTFSTTEGYRIDKSNNTKIPTITTTVEDTRGNSAAVTCDKDSFDQRQGVLEAVAQLYCKGSFDKEYKKAIKFNEIDDKSKRTCKYCGQIFDTAEEREAHEAWPVECRKARHERYKLRKRAKEIAFEQKAQEMAKEMTEEEK